MQRKCIGGMNCSIARSLEEVGEWWSLLIVREMMQGMSRFDEFQKGLGIARNILTSRLERLIELGIVRRFPLPERANTDGYRLTAKGEDLFPVIVALMQWGDRWLCPQGKPPTRMVEHRSGRPIETLTVQAKGGKPLSFREVRYTPGPGATSTTRAVIDARNERVLEAG